MQTEKSQPEDKRIMPETRRTEFPAFSVDPRVGISRSASETNDWSYFLPIIGKMTANPERHSELCVTARK